MYYSLALAYLFYGIFAATMPLMWNIGSAYFAKTSDAGDYQAIHLSLTGLRALLFPLFGVFLYEIAGFFYTFLTGAITLFIGIIVLYHSMWRHQKL